MYYMKLDYDCARDILLKAEELCGYTDFLNPYQVSLQCFARELPDYNIKQIYYTIMKLKEHIKAIAADLYLGVNNLLATSSETGYGKTDVLGKIRAVIDLANEQENEDFEEMEEEEE